VLLGDLAPRTIVLADKAYDSNAIRDLIERQGAVPTIPSKANRRWKSCFSRTLYKGRNTVDIDQTWRLSRRKIKVTSAFRRRQATYVGGPHAHGFEFRDRRRVSEHQLESIAALSERAVGYTTSLNPIIQRLLRYADVRGQLSDRPFIRLSFSSYSGLSALLIDDAGNDKLIAHHCSIVGVAPLGGPPAFGVQNVGDLRCAVAGFVEFGHACNQRRIAAERGDPRDRSDDPVRRPVPAMPVAFEVHLLGLTDHLDDNPLEEQANNFLTLSLGRGRGLPERR
jgi:transposase